jgi:hypothetical protein
VSSTVDERPQPVAESGERAGLQVGAGLKVAVERVADRVPVLQHVALLAVGPRLGLCLGGERPVLPFAPALLK